MGVKPRQEKLRRPVRFVPLNPMHDLGEALARLRREVESGLAAIGTRSVGRVTVSIGLQPLADGNWGLALGPTPHVLSFDLERPPTPPGTKPEPSASNHIDEAEVARQLDAVFGTPGFDSAARATVFRETVSGLDREQLPALWDGLEGIKGATNPDLDRALHTLQRLLERGDAGIIPGARILRQIFSRHPVDAVLDLVGKRWRFGTGHRLEEPETEAKNLSQANEKANGYHPPNG
jgi:hypothetical protein